MRIEHIALWTTDLERVKNDAVDAKTLAHLLRTNLLAEAWIAPPDAREARRLVRTRAGLVRMRSRVQSQLHALLADLGVIRELTTRLLLFLAASGWTRRGQKVATSHTMPTLRRVFASE